MYRIVRDGVGVSKESDVLYTLLGVSVSTDTTVHGPCHHIHGLSVLVGLSNSSSDSVCTSSTSRVQYMTLTWGEGIKYV